MNQYLKKDALQVVSGLGELNKRFANKSILITGAAGFLGSQFISYFTQLNESLLADSSCKIIAWDNFIRGKTSWIEQLGIEGKLTLENRDISSDSIDKKIDFIIHAASIASPQFYRMYPLETMDTNVNGTRNVLQFCKENPIESLLYLSTSEIYGDPGAEHIPTPEEYWGNVSCTGPRACYDESKRYAETLCVNYFKIYNVPVKIVRPFNNYGPGLKPEDGRVMSDFFRDMILENKIKLFSDGSATRTFCYASDAIEGFIRLLLSEFDGEFFNIGTATPEISMLELAKKIKHVADSGCTIEFSESNDPNYNTDNPKRRCPSIKKAQNLLGYNPKVSLDKGLLRTFEYYKSILK